VIVSAWALVVAAIAVWSVRHDPPSVPDQRDIRQALPYLENATRAMLAAADVDGQVVVLGAPVFTDDCRITPVRSGVSASRTVIVHVRADQAAVAFATIAAGLPAGFKARAEQSAGGARQDLYADAGGYVAIEATAQADDTVFSLRAATGCRPKAAGVDLNPADAPATTPPPAFTRALRLLAAQVTGGAAAIQREVPCRNGTVARTVLSGEVPEPKNFGAALEAVEPPAAIVQADPHDWAYRDGGVSVVVTGSGGLVRVAATVGCP
jgi:hypothetical protein